MPRRRPLIALALLVVFGVAGAASGDDHTVPTVKLRVAGEAQPGELVFSTWLRGDDDVCVSQHIDGPGTFPPALEVPKGTHTARLVLRKPQRPRSLRIRAWRDVEDGHAVGPAKALRSRLVPHRGDDQAIDRWTATFEVELGPDYYIRAYAAWRDVDGCGLQELVRTYHLGSA